MGGDIDPHRQVTCLGLLPIIEEYSTLRDELVIVLQKMKNVGQPLSTSMAQPILRGMIESLAPEILCNGHGGFVVTRE
jgi:hypothetical protein